MTSCIHLVINLALSAIILPQVVFPAVLYPEENDGISYVNDHYKVDDNEDLHEFAQPSEHDSHDGYVEDSFIHHAFTTADEVEHDKKASAPESELDDDNSGSLLQDLFHYISGNSDSKSDVKKHNKREYPDDMDEGYDGAPGQDNAINFESDYPEDDEDEDLDEDADGVSGDDEDDDGEHEDVEEEEEEEEEEEDLETEDDEGFDMSNDDEDAEERTINERSPDNTNLLEEIDDDTLKAFYTFIDNTISDHVKNITTPDYRQPQSGKTQTSIPTPTIGQTRKVQVPSQVESRNRTSLPYISKGPKTYKTANNTNLNVKLEKDLQVASDQVNEGRIPRQAEAKEGETKKYDPFEHSGDNQIFVHVRDANDRKEQDAHKPPEYDYRYQNAYDAFQKDHQSNSYDNCLDKDEDYNYGYNFPKIKSLAKNYETTSSDSLPVVLMKVENMDSYSNARRVREPYENEYQYPDYYSSYQSQSKYKRDIDHVVSANDSQEIATTNDDNQNTTNVTPNQVHGKAYIFESVSINNSPYYTVETFTQDGHQSSNVYKINDVFDHGQQIKNQIESIPSTLFTYLVDSFLYKDPITGSNITQNGTFINIFGEDVPKQMQKRDLRQVQETVGEDCQKNTVEALEKVIAYKLSQCPDIQNENLTESERKQQCRNIIMNILSEVSDENVIRQIVENYESIIGNCETQVDGQCLPCYCCDNDEFEKTFINIKNLNIFYEFGESGQNCINVPTNRIQYTVPYSYPLRRMSPIPVRHSYPNQVDPYRNPAYVQGTTQPLNQYEFYTNKDEVKSLKETDKHRIELHHNDNKNKVAYKREDTPLDTEQPNPTNVDENDTIEDTLDSDNRYANQNITTLDVEEQKPLIVMEDNNADGNLEIETDENSVISDETEKLDEPTEAKIDNKYAENEIHEQNDSESDLSSKSDAQVTSESISNDEKVQESDSIVSVNETSVDTQENTISVQDSTANDTVSSTLEPTEPLEPKENEGTVESVNNEETTEEVKSVAGHANVTGSTNETSDNVSDQHSAGHENVTESTKEASSNVSEQHSAGHDSVAESTNETSANVSDVSNSTNETSDNVSDVSNSTNETSANVSDVSDSTNETSANVSDQPIALELQRTPESETDAVAEIPAISNVTEENDTLNSTSSNGQEETAKIENATNAETEIEQDSTTVDITSNDEANKESEPSSYTKIEPENTNLPSQSIDESEQSEDTLENEKAIENDIVLEERVREQKDTVENTNTVEPNEIANEDGEKSYGQQPHTKSTETEHKQNLTVNEIEENNLNEIDLNEESDSKEQGKRETDSGSIDESENVNMKYKSMVYKKEQLHDKESQIEKPEAANSEDDKSTTEDKNIETDSVEQKYESSQKHDDNSADSTANHHGVSYDEDIYCRPPHAANKPASIKSTSETESNNDKQEDVNENDSKIPNTESENTRESTSNDDGKAEKEEEHIDVDEEDDEQSERPKRKDEGDVTEDELKEEQNEAEKATEDDEEDIEDYDENEPNQQDDEYEEQEENDEDYEEPNYEIYEPKHHNDAESQDDAPVLDEKDEENDEDDDKEEETEVESEDNESEEIVEQSSEKGNEITEEQREDHESEEIVEQSSEKGNEITEEQREGNESEEIVEQSSEKGNEITEEHRNDDEKNEEDEKESEEAEIKEKEKVVDNSENTSSENLAEEHYKEDEESEQIRTVKSAHEELYEGENKKVKSDSKSQDVDYDYADYDSEEYVRRCDVEKLILDILESKPHPDHELRHSDMFPHRPNNKYKELVKDIASYFAKKNITSGDDICVYEEYGSKRGDDDVIILSGTKLYKNGVTKKDGQNYNLIIKKPHQPHADNSSAYNFVEYKTKDDASQNENKPEKMSLHTEKKHELRKHKSDKSNQS